MTETLTLGDATQPQGREELRKDVLELLSFFLDDPKIDEATDAILSFLPQSLPVKVSEEALEHVGGMYHGSRIPASELEAMLNAALPHAKTGAQVEEALLERLAKQAENQGLRYERPLHEPSGDIYEAWDGPNDLAGWLRAQKGKSDG